MKQQSYSANTTNIQINVTEATTWKSVVVTEGTLLINEKERLANYKLEKSLNTTGVVTVTVIPTQYAPNPPIIGIAHSTISIPFIISQAVEFSQGGHGTANINETWRY